MRFEHVRLAGLAHLIAPERVTSLELEQRLAPTYDRLRLSPGRLELMSGIRERRFFPRGTLPSVVAAEAGQLALERSGVAREQIGLLIHASVCRDYLEPATASLVHERLELPAICASFDLSNACLGVANAMVIAAEMIERGSIEAALIVAGEDARALVEETIRDANADATLTRTSFKRAFASLTIGSGAAALVLERSARGSAGRRLLGGVSRADAKASVLCRGGARAGAGPLMSTDSEALLQAGNALAARTFTDFLAELGWTRASVQRVVTHQVGVAHRRLLLETLALDLECDFQTVETLGNIGSVSLPLSLSMAFEQGFLRPGEGVALLGIGSGLNCLMLGLRA
jgi:3-oxoacyl-[acyl-carrier-protein] synthase-3